MEFRPDWCANGEMAVHSALVYDAVAWVAVEPIDSVDTSACLNLSDCGVEPTAL